MEGRGWEGRKGGGGREGEEGGKGRGGGGGNGGRASLLYTTSCHILTCTCIR